MDITRFEGRTAIVSGGGKGIGEATVRLLAAQGAAVVAADIDIASAEAVSAELGPQVRAAHLDVRSPESWAKLVDETERSVGTVDILVNNAGIADPGPLEDWDLARFQRTLDVNLLGVFNGMQAVAPGMRAAKRGSIVNVGAVVGFKAVPHMAGYTTAKWGLRGLTKTGALELGPHGVRVNAVHPGMTRTPMTAGVSFDVSSIALGRVGEPDDIAQAVLFFASDDSRFVTGADLLVDGGQMAGPAVFAGLPD